MKTKTIENIKKVQKERGIAENNMYKLRIQKGLKQARY